MRGSGQNRSIGRWYTHPLRMLAGLSLCGITGATVEVNDARGRTFKLRHSVLCHKSCSGLGLNRVIAADAFIGCTRDCAVEVDSLPHHLTSYHMRSHHVKATRGLMASRPQPPSGLSRAVWSLCAPPLQGTAGPPRLRSQEWPSSSRAGSSYFAPGRWQELLLYSKPRVQGS